MSQNILKILKTPKCFLYRYRILLAIPKLSICFPCRPNVTKLVRPVAAIAAPGDSRRSIRGAAALAACTVHNAADDVVGDQLRQD